MESIKKFLDKIIEIFCISILGVMTILVSWQVITRYLFNKPSAITAQLSQYLFVWLVLYGAAYVFGKREHMKIAFIKDKMPKNIQFIADVFQELIVASFTIGIMLYGGYLSTLKQMGQSDAALQIPIGVVYSAIPISGLFTVFYTIYNIRKAIKLKSKKVDK